MSRVYLAGSIMGDPDPITWRKRAQELLAPEHVGVNPMDTETAAMAPKQLVAHDLRLVDNCSAIILNAGRTSWGSAMEIFFAAQIRIPVVAFNVPKEGASLWLLAMISFHVETLESACVLIKNRLNGTRHV